MAKLFIKLIVLLLTVLAVKACLPQRTNIPIEPYAPDKRKLILVPTEGIPAAFMGELRTRLEARHKFGVISTVEIPLPADGKIPGSEQYDIEKVARVGGETCRNMAVNNEYCVVITSS